ncbi:MAG: hypothetical protein K2O04_01335 [Clostridiales bacterium]|nr:hypothetical protein [Clostridiales bacterium]
MKDNKTTQKPEDCDELLKQYYAQVDSDDDVHTYHIDGYTYGDYTDSCC